MALPYRDPISISWIEEELWQALDWALEEALFDRSGIAWAMTWNVLVDAQRLGCKSVEVAATSLLHELSPKGIAADWDLPAGRLDIPPLVAVEDLES